MPQQAIDAVGTAISEMIGELSKMDGDQLIADRRRKYLELGATGLAA